MNSSDRGVPVTRGGSKSDVYLKGLEESDLIDSDAPPQ